MAQPIGTARRPVTNSVAAFAAGTLFAVAAMATCIILALALGVNVGLRDEAGAAQSGAVAPVGTYDGRPDPIEDAYIKGARSGLGARAGVASARPGAYAYEGRLDPVEQIYIDGAHSGTRTGPRSEATSSPLQDQSWPQAGEPWTHLVPR